MDDKALLDAIRDIVREETTKIIDDKLEPINARLDKIETRMSNVEETLETVKISQMKVELEQYPRISAALDGVVGGIEKSREQDTRILFLEQKVDRHDTEIACLKAK